jgi:hypothetical protein
MNKLLRVVLLTLILQGCAKEYSKENTPPVAVAGRDRVLSLPLDSLKVDGSYSYDQEGDIQQYSWRQLSGDSTLVFATPHLVKTMVKGFSAGNYKVELKVTDQNGLTDTDTLEVVASPMATLPTGNVFFYFTDQTGSIGPYNAVIPYAPTLDLVKVNIINYPEGIIRGIWSKNYGPHCPVFQDYNADPEMYALYDLAPGVYNWTADITGVNLGPYPYLGGTPLAQFMAVPHTQTGTITVPANTSCMTVEIVF